MPTTPKPALRLREKAARDPEAWLRRAVPVLYGSHTARTWVVNIRRMLAGR